MVVLTYLLAFKPLPVTDAEIYRGIASKDNQTFQYVYGKFMPAIQSMILKNNGNEEDAYDIFQEGMVALWVNVQKESFQLSSQVKISTYLYTICRNLWISKLRKVKPKAHVEEIEQIEDPSDLNEVEEQYSKVKVLETQLSKLGDSCQRLLRLFYFKKTSLKAIAVQMNITEKTAKNNKYRCMQKLRGFYSSQKSA